MVANEGSEVSTLLNGSNAFAKHLSVKITRLPAVGILSVRSSGGGSTALQPVQVGEIFTLNHPVVFFAPTEQNGSPFASFDYQVVETDDVSRASTNT